MHADLHKLLPPDVYSALDTSSGMEATARTKLQRTCRDIDCPVGARGTAPASSAPGHSAPPQCKPTPPTLPWPFHATWAPARIKRRRNRPMAV